MFPVGSCVVIIGCYIQDQHLHQLMTAVRGGIKHGFYNAYAKQVLGEIVSLLRNHAPFYVQNTIYD